MKLTEKERENWTNFKKETKYNCKEPYERLSPEKMERIKKEIKKGWGNRRVGVVCNSCEKTVRKIRKEMGL